MTPDIEKFINQFPFITVAKSGSNEFVGIVQNQDANLISMYIFADIKTPELRKKFLEYGNEWWWETNRMIPINIIIGQPFTPYRECLRTFNMKDFEIKFGPTVCLKNIIKKRVKRRNIQLIRKTN